MIDEEPYADRYDYAAYDDTTMRNWTEEEMNDEDKWVEDAFLQGQRYIVRLEAEISELKDLLKQAIEGLQDDGHDEPYSPGCMKCSVVKAARAALEDK
jgi:hypothetical protein